MSRPSRAFPFSCEGSSTSWGMARRRRTEEEERKKRGQSCGFTPEDTVSSGAIRDESRSSTRVPSLLSLRERITTSTCVCVCLADRITPLWSPLLSPIALFLSLISFHSPMTLPSSDIFVFVSLRRRTHRGTSFVSVSTDLVAA